MGEIRQAKGTRVVSSAMAMGLDTLAALSEAGVSAGDLVRAAQASWAASIGLVSGVEKGTQKAITPTFSWVQMASIPYANSGGGEGGHNEQRPSSSDRRKPPSLL